MNTVSRYAPDGKTLLRPCPRCPEENKWHPATLEYFGERKNRKPGLRSLCRNCEKAYRQAYNQRYYQENLEEERTRSLKYHYEHREERIEYDKKWGQEHREERAAYREEHREERNAYNRWYRQTPQGKISGTVGNHRRRARLKAIPGSFTAQEFTEQVERQKHRCYWCHKKLTKIHVDHIIPVSRPGSSNYIHNIVASCPTCNVRRNKKLPHEWPEGGRLL